MKFFLQMEVNIFELFALMYKFSSTVMFCVKFLSFVKTVVEFILYIKSI